MRCWVKEDNRHERFKQSYSSHALKERPVAIGRSHFWSFEILALTRA